MVFSSRQDHDVRINEIASTALSIVGCGQTMPEEIRHALQDVVSHRKEARAFYKPLANLKADVGHTHYITVLENTLRTFDRSNKASSGLSSHTPPVDVRDRIGWGTGTPFDPLRTIGIEEAQNDQAARVSSNEAEELVGKENLTPKKTRKKKTGKKKGKSRKTHQSDAPASKSKASKDIVFLDSIIQNQETNIDWEDETDDVYFMVYCFFKDWNSLREYLQERWCDFQDGCLSLAAVSLITNTAFELLQRSERELLSRMPPQNGISTYEGMTAMLFIEIGMPHVDYDVIEREGRRDKSIADEKIYEEADWLCLPIYWSLVEWLEMAPPRKIPSTFDDSTSGSPLTTMQEATMENLLETSESVMSC